MNTQQANQSMSGANIIIVGVSFILILGLIIFCARFLIAEKQLYDIEQSLSYWENDSSALDSQSWSKAQNKIALALAVNPYESRLHKAQADIYGFAYQSPWQVVDDMSNLESFYSFKANAGLEQVAFMKQAALLTPTSPYGWIDLALTKTKNQQYDDEFTLAFAQALKNGSQISTVQRYLADLSVQHPYALHDNPPLKAMMLENLSNALANDARSQRAVINTLRRGFVLPVFCRELDVDSLGEIAQKACPQQ